jgi:hypothetical protein
MTEADENSAENSGWFYFLSILSGLFFLFAVAGVLLLAYILLQPHSDIASTLLTILSIGQGGGASTGLRSVIDLLIGGVGASGSLSLSLALAAIYLSQNQILETQLDIQDTQTDIMKRQKLPVVAAHESGVQLHEGRPTLDRISPDGTLNISTSGDGPYVSVAVENHGEEAAEQIQMACLVDVPSEEDPLIHTGVTELTVDGMFTKPPEGEGALLPPTKNISLLRGTPILSSSQTTVDKPKMCVSGITDQLQKLSDDGSDDETGDVSPEKVVRFGFVLIFSNSVNDKFNIPLEPAYSVSPSQFERDDDVKITTLKQKAVVYNINDLIEETSWSIPNEAFVER